MTEGVGIRRIHPLVAGVLLESLEAIADRVVQPVRPLLGAEVAHSHPMSFTPRSPSVVQQLGEPGQEKSFGQIAIGTEYDQRALLLHGGQSTTRPPSKRGLAASWR